MRRWYAPQQSPTPRRYGKSTVHVTHGLASFEIDVPALDEVERRVTSVLASGYPYVVAIEAERVCGYAYASAFRTRPAYRHTDEDSVYLAPDAMGRGLGRLLLTRLLDMCTALDFRQMIAVIGDSANAASIGRMRPANPS